MAERGGWRDTVGWLAFPAIPALLAGVYHRAFNLGGSDPRLWTGWTWPLLLGPLFGFAFLAGATAELPDPDGLTLGPRSWGRRRVLWVAIGPWLGFACWVPVFFGVPLADGAYRRLYPGRTLLPEPIPQWLSTALLWSCAVTASQGWLLAGWLAVRRARRLGRLGRSLWRGFAMALGFLTTLVGGFWAATSVWRSYFFDPRPAPALLITLAGLSLVILDGCGNPTLGEVRRSRLFESMLTAWVLGLALGWRWWSRRRE